MMSRASLFLIALILSLSVSLQAKIRSFEGNINFVRETVFDTTYISIMVKDHMVKVDEFDQHKNLLSSQLINLEDDQVFALSKDQKLFVQVPVSPRLANSTNNLEINKTPNCKEINGHVCYQWRVKDKARNTEIAYWVFEERFYFFEMLLQLLNRTEYSFSVFSDIPNNEGFLPMLTEERTLLRKDKLRIAVVDIREEPLNNSLFEIPKDYKSARR